MNRSAKRLSKLLLDAVKKGIGDKVKKTQVGRDIGRMNRAVESNRDRRGRESREEDRRQGRTRG